MFTLDQVVPWGRNLDEYWRMFALGGGRVTARILDCAAGPSSFNAEATVRGFRVVSADPMYAFSAEWLATFCWVAPVGRLVAGFALRQRAPALLVALASWREQIGDRIEKTFEQVMEQTRRNAHQFDRAAVAGFAALALPGEHERRVERVGDRGRD